MGKYDSSRTRVVPVFDGLFERDPTGGSWISRLLALPRHGARTLSTLPDLHLREGCEGVTYGWGSHEVPLRPPRALLEWLIRNLPPVRSESALRSGETLMKRQALARRDPAVVAEALELLDRQADGRGWHILEGPSYPDVFLDTDEALIVIEGKRTEPGPTTATTFMPERHQMLRHMDCAWEIRGDRPVYGLFIIEGPALPPEWVGYASETISESVLRSSLPHRTIEERSMLKAGFLGVTTWQTVCDALKIDRCRLIPELIAVKP